MEAGSGLPGRVVVGCGHIGKDLTRLLKPFECRVLANDIRDYPDFYQAHGVEPVGLQELLTESDLVTLHVPLTDETRAFINATTLAHMKPDAFLVNTSRGGVIDERALGQVLAEGKLAGAGLDVYADEPPALDHPFLSAPRVLLTPHVAGLSDQALIRVATEASQGIIDVLQGRRPASPVNPEVL